MELVFIITLLIITALFSILLRHRALIEGLAVAASFVTLVGAIIIARSVAAVGIYTSSIFFTVDALGAIILLIIGFLCFATTIYSVRYFREESAKQIVGFTRVKQYFVLLNLFVAAMVLATVASSPIFAWIAIEATTLSTAFLISFYHKPSSIEGAWKYLIINSVGLLLGFLGTLLYFTAVGVDGAAGFVSWQTLLANASSLDPEIAKIAFVFVLIGYGTKIGLAPMHTWKPDAYSKAPNPIAVLLSGALFPVAFYLLLKFKTITDLSTLSEFTDNFFILFGMLSIGVAAMIMFNARNYKRLLAYSSIENAGVIALGFGFGGIAVFGAILHLIYHSLVKAVLFFSAGNFLLKFHSSKIRHVKGAVGILPYTSALFIAGFLIITGTPPFGIFLTKIYILSYGMETHPVVTFIAIFFMTIVFISFLKHVVAMLFGTPPRNVVAGEESFWLIIPPAFFLLLIVMLSFYIPPFLLVLINSVVAQY